MASNRATAETNPPAPEETDEAGGPAEGFAPIEEHELALGEPIPQSIWSGDGILLLPKGGLVTSEGQRQILLDRGHWHDPGVAPWSEEARIQVAFDQDEDPFLILAGLPRHIEQIHTAALHAWDTETPESDDFTFTFERLISKIDNLTEQWTDPMLAFVHRPTTDLPYSTHHPLDQALLASVLAREHGFETASRRAMIGACFLADIALHSIRDTLHCAASSLSDAGRERLADHPRQSRAIAAHAGVTDPLTLYLIEHHHCRSTQSDTAMPAEQAIVAFADAYTAMLAPRGDRPARDPRTCYRISLAHDGHCPDQVRAIIATLGFYPPGTSVQLSDGRYGVVTQRGTRPTTGSGVIVLKPNGYPIGVRLASFREGEGLTIADLADPCLPNAGIAHFYNEWERNERERT